MFPRSGAAIMTARCCIMLIVGLWLVQALPHAAEAKKLIYYGWSIRDTQYVRMYWQKMETMPFDGVGIQVAIDRTQPPHTGNELGWQVVSPTQFDITQFQAAINDLKTAKWTRFTDNFLAAPLSSSYAADLNWFDDGRWRIVVNNFSVLAQIAAAGGLKGLILDPEAYSGYQLFNYQTQNGQVPHTFSDYQAKARQRGREVMTAIAAALPQPVLLSLYAYSEPFLNWVWDNPPNLLEDAVYALLPAFYDGLLEAMPAGGQLVDGYESSYAYKERSQFTKAYTWIHSLSYSGSLSQVPDLYTTIVKAGFGLWPDYRGNVDYRTPAVLEQSVTDALQISDEYVWIYSEDNVDYFPRSGAYPPTSVPQYYLDAFTAARSSIASNLIIADSSSTSFKLGYLSNHLTLRQSFTMPSDVSVLTGIEIGLFKKGAPAYPITVSITSSLKGTPLYHTTIQPSQIVSTSRTSPTWVSVILPEPLSITPGTRYFLSLSVDTTRLWPFKLRVVDHGSRDRAPPEAIAWTLPRE